MTSSLKWLIAFAFLSIATQTCFGEPPTDESVFSEAVFDLISDLHVAASSQDDEAYQKTVDKIIEEGADAVPTLRILLTKLDDGFVRFLVIDTLRRMGPVASDATAELQLLLKHENDRTRVSALRALEKISPQWGEEHIGELIRLLDDSNDLVTHDAVLMLWACKEKAKDALPELFKIIKDQKCDTSTRVSATYSLASIAPDSMEVAQVLTESLADDLLTIPAVSGLTKIGPQAVMATPMLILLLDSDQEEVQQAATKCLGAIGPGAKSSLPRLQKLAKDANPRHRSLASAAKKAIQAIQKD